jgi:hypothetical protein
MATRSTLASDKFQVLLASRNVHVAVQAWLTGPCH